MVTNIREWFTQRARIFEPNNEATAIIASPTVLRRAAKAAPPGEPEEESLSTRLEDAFKWAAGGFTLVSAVLLFFGIKDGVLDQALRLNPVASLCIFLLLGCGVVAALFVPAMPDARIYIWPVLAAIGLMILLTSLFIPNFETVEAAQQNLVPKASADRLDGWNGPLIALAILIGITAYIILVSAIIKADQRKTALSAAALIAAICFLLWLWQPWKNEEPLGAERTPLIVVAVLTLAGAVISALAAVLSAANRRVLIVISVTAAIVAASLALYLQQPWTDNSSNPPLSNASLLTVLLVILFTVGIVLGFIYRTGMQVIAAMVILAVSATSLGLYGATKLAVQSKMLAEVPRVTAKLESVTGGTVVRVTAAAGRMRGEALQISLTGQPRAAEPELASTLAAKTADDTATTIWQALIFPNSLDEINETVDVPITRSRWESLTLGYCQAGVPGPGDPKAGNAACLNKQAQLTTIELRNPGAEVGIQQVSGHIEPGTEKNLTVKIDAKDVAAGTRVLVEVCRTKGQHLNHLSSATLSPDDAGILTWTANIPGGAAGEGLVLRSRICPPGTDCAKGAPWSTLASYTLP